MKKRMEESQYRELLKESITSQWEKFEYYRNICKLKKTDLPDILMAIDNEEYFRIPAVAASAFKMSKGLIRDLSDFTQEGKFQVSSSTSGDPSYIYTNRPELDKILDNYRLTFGIEGVSKAVAFSPSLRILSALSRKAAYPGYKSIARMKIALDAGRIHYSDLMFTLDVNLLKTLFSNIFNGPAVLKRKPAGEISEFIRQCEISKEKISLGGIVLLLIPYINQLKEGEFNLGENVHFAFSGGGYSGSKGSIKGEKVDKPDFSRRLSSVFGIDYKLLATNLKDMYGSTESSAVHEGYWSEDIDDFLFETWHESRAYIVDPETEEPLKSGEGLFKVITPYANGNPSAANVSLLQLDNATVRKCRDDLTVTHFSHIKRALNASVEGCAYKAEEISNQ